MIILQNKSHGEITRVCMGIFPTAVRNKKCGQILNKNTSPYFHSVSLAVCPLTMLKRTHFCELSISRFITYIGKAQGCTYPNARSKKRKIRAQNDQAAISLTQNPSTYTEVSFQFTSNLIALCFNNFQFSRVYIHLYHDH